MFYAAFFDRVCRIDIRFRVCFMQHVLIESVGGNPFQSVFYAAFFDRVDCRYSFQSVFYAAFFDRVGSSWP